MEKCEWCSKEVKGEIEDRPRYHPNCKDYFNEYKGAVQRLSKTCTKAAEYASWIARTPMEVDEPMRKLTSELEEAGEQLSQCNKLFATRKGGA